MPNVSIENEVFVNNRVLGAVCDSIVNWRQTFYIRLVSGAVKCSSDFGVKVSSEWTFRNEYSFGTWQLRQRFNNFQMSKIVCNAPNVIRWQWQRSHVYQSEWDLCKSDAFINASYVNDIEIE